MSVIKAMMEIKNYGIQVTVCKDIMEIFLFVYWNISLSISKECPLVEWDNNKTIVW